MRRRTEALSAALAELDAAQLRRRRRVLSVASSGGHADSSSAVLVDGRRLLNFCSNDYLGLARHPALAEAMAAAAAALGSGSGASHLVSGHATEHHALEEELAAFVGRQRALLFSTGYMANAGAIGSFATRGEIVLQDRLNHASLIDGTRVAGARLLRYAHADAGDAAVLLAGHDTVSVLATDGVFSMDGDVAPLAELARACRAHETWLLVDDAHGIGVAGPGGAGSVAAAGLTADDVPLLVGTLGKALGSFGAFVAGDDDSIELLIQRSRSYIYTTALPPPVAAATRAALRVATEESWRREHLQGLIQRFRAGAATLGLPLLPSATAIQPLLAGDSGRALRLAAALEAAGFWVSAIRPPTVPAGSARLRITLSAAHQEAEVDSLLSALGALSPLWREAEDRHE
jgi:8-amino-7-oxononanoate synthase